MSTPVTLDSFLTTLTCLSTVSDNKPMIMLNSKTEFQIDQNLGCPPQTLNFLSSRIRQLNEQDNEFQQQITERLHTVKDFETKLHKLQTNIGNSITSCSEQPSGFVPITLPDLNMSLIVYCQQNFKNFGSNWLLVAQRNTGDLNFMRDWADYQHGFGELSREFFIGLNALHALTLAQSQELLVYMEKQNGESAYAHYDYFSIGHETEKYALKILGKYNGTAGDALRYHAGQKFTTYDMDNDVYGANNCAQVHQGAWWYAQCMESNLFGKYQKTDEPELQDHKGILWKRFLDGPKGSLKVVQMFIRPKIY